MRVCFRPNPVFQTAFRATAKRPFISRSSACARCTACRPNGFGADARGASRRPCLHVSSALLQMRRGCISTSRFAVAELPISKFVRVDIPPLSHQHGRDVRVTPLRRRKHHAMRRSGTAARRRPSRHPGRHPCVALPTPKAPGSMRRTPFGHDLFRSRAGRARPARTRAGRFREPNRHQSAPRRLQAGLRAEGSRLGCGRNRGLGRSDRRRACSSPATRCSMPVRSTGQVATPRSSAWTSASSVPSQPASISPPPRRYRLPR